MTSPTLNANSFVDKNIGNVSLSLGDRHDGGITTVVHILVRPKDIRCDESGELKGRFVSLFLTREELKELLRIVEQDWAEQVRLTGDPNHKAPT